MSILDSCYTSLNAKLFEDAATLLAGLIILEHIYLIVFQDKQKYEISTNTFKSCDELVNFYVDLCDRYPEIKVLVDPFAPQVSNTSHVVLLLMA